MEYLANTISARRQHLNMTQEELAQRIGVARPTIVFYEQGLRRPDIETAMRLARALECTVDDLYSFQKEGWI